MKHWFMSRGMVIDLKRMFFLIVKFSRRERDRIVLQTVFSIVELVFALSLYSLQLPITQRQSKRLNEKHSVQFDLLLTWLHRDPALVTSQFI